MQAWDAATLATVAIVLGAASFAATLLSRLSRGLHINPNDALRAE